MSGEGTKSKFENSSLSLMHFFKTHTAYTRKRGEDAEGATDRSQSERKIQLKRGAEFATLLEQKKTSIPLWVYRW